MKYISTNKKTLSIAWLAVSVFLIHQLPGLTAENTVNSNNEPTVRNKVIQNNDNSAEPLSSSMKKYDFNTLKKILKQNNISQQNLNTIDLEHKMASMENKFNAFPESATIDLTLREIDLPSVLRIIAKEGQKNIVIDKSVQGNVTAELFNVSLNEAMQTILTSEELEARVEGNTIFVASRGAMATKGLNRKFIKAFKLNNANALDVAKLLEASIFNKGFKVTTQASTKKTQIPSGIAMQAISFPNNYYPEQNSAQNGYGNNNYNSNDYGRNNNGNNGYNQPSMPNQSKLIDSKTIRGKIEKLNPGDNFYDASKLASEIKLQNITSTIDNIDVSNNDNGAIVIPDTRTNSLLIAGLKEDIALAENAIKYLDKPLPQVSLEVSLVEVDKNDTNNLGLTISNQAGNFSSGFNAVSGTSTPEVVGLATAQGTNSLMYNTVKTLPDNIAIKLNALIQNNKAKLLSNPNVLALDGSESLVKITDQIVSKMTVTYVTTAGGSQPLYTPELADVGVVLNILPKIGDDGYVTMRIRPSVTSSLGKAPDLPTDQGFANLISTREILIQDVRVKSGKTLAIAGLLSDDKNEQVAKIPYLSAIPILGQFFTNTTKTENKKELVILITPKIINQDNNSL